MFCPKCGNNVPDGATFCNKCGNRFDSAPVATASNVGTGAINVPSASGGAKLSTSPLAIVSAVCTILAIIVTLMPWYEFSSSISAISSGISGAASWFGMSDNSLAFQDEYSVSSLIGFANTYSQYASVLNSMGSSQAGTSSALITLFSWACFILWIVALFLSVWGALLAIIKGNVGILRTASIFMLVLPLLFYVFVNMGGSNGEATVMPMICLILALAALGCSFRAIKKA